MHVGANGTVRGAEDPQWHPVRTFPLIPVVTHSQSHLSHWINLTWSDNPRQNHTASVILKVHSHTVVFSQSFHHTITLAYPNSDGGTVGRVGAQGRLAPACFRFPLPVSCPSLLVLSADIDGNGSRRQTFWLRSHLTWASHIQSEKLGEVPFGW